MRAHSNRLLNSVEMSSSVNWGEMRDVSSAYLLSILVLDKVRRFEAKRIYNTVVLVVELSAHPSLIPDIFSLLSHPIGECILINNNTGARQLNAARFSGQ